MDLDGRRGGSKQARPGAVTLASWLALVAAGLITVDTLLSQYDYLSGMGVYHQAVRDGIVAGQGAYAPVGIGFHLLLGLTGVGVGVALAVLAVRNRRGRNGSRIATWVLGTPVVLVYGAVGALTLSLAWTDPATSRSELEPLYEAALPSWFPAASAATTVAVPLVMAAVLLLLVLPASNRFYRPLPPASTAGGLLAAPA